jgi:V8-like Glu-specific endopeptidase
VAVTQLLEYQYQVNGWLDYSILKLANNPGDRHGVARISPMDATQNSTLVVFQHPATRPMEVAVGPLLFISGPQVYHQVDTDPGSSGSGILLKSTGQLVVRV